MRLSATLDGSNVIGLHVVLTSYFHHYLAVISRTRSIGNRSFSFVGVAIATPGYVPLAGELLPKHGEILFGFASGLVSLVGFSLVWGIGILLDSVHSYDLLFYGLSASTFLGFVLFSLFANAEPIDTLTYRKM